MHAFIVDFHAFVDVAQGGHQDAETLLGNGVSRR
jgi:hypothetical protein